MEEYSQVERYSKAYEWLRNHPYELETKNELDKLIKNFYNCIPSIEKGSTTYGYYYTELWKEVGNEGLPKILNRIKEMILPVIEADDILNPLNRRNNIQIFNTIHEILVFVHTNKNNLRYHSEIQRKLKRLKKRH